MSPAAHPIVRLTRRPQFLYVQKGKRAARSSVIVEARLRPEPPGPTIGAGFTATKKIGNAVVRNRAKRRLREAARRWLAELGAPGADYVFVARAATAEAPWAALLDDVQNALIRLRADLKA